MESNEAIQDPLYAAVNRESVESWKGSYPKTSDKLKPIDAKAIKVGGIIYMWRAKSTAAKGGSFYPFEIIAEGEGISFRTLCQTPSFPPGHTEDHPEGTVLPANVFDPSEFYVKKD